ncbi:MAG: glutamate--tRNA ligase [Alphaproteobacteria bacterium]
MTVITRFAPSPTGFLHIGGARTALFNWLYARHHGGKFLLRIEDTDRKRSTDEAIEAILSGLKWFGTDWDGEAVFQTSRVSSHIAAAERLLAEDKAYKCYCSPDELTEMRNAARAEGRPVRYDGRWRDKSPDDAPADVAPVIRLKAPLDGVTVIEDEIQGRVEVANEQLDDMILLRADGTPTYMLAVVVDDHDMGITHIIRGDDHLTNAFRQFQLYKALGWDVPVFAHMSLIHGADGGKLSKRHGALGVETYRDDGFLPEALRNYLLRLGWSHGDDEIISDQQAIEWFDFDGVGKSPARFDVAKLTNLNANYIREADDARLLELIAADAAPEAKERLKRGMAGLKERAKTIVELTENAQFYIKSRPLEMSGKAAKILNEQGLEHLAIARDSLDAETDWTHDALHDATKAAAEAADLKLGKLAQPLRAALTGSNISPGVFDVMEVLGREESLGRIDDALK